MSLAKAFLVFKHVDPCSAQHYRKRELCRLIIKLISSIESCDKNFSKHFKEKWCQEKLWNRFEQLIRGIESNIDNKIYPDNFSDGIKEYQTKTRKVSVVINHWLRLRNNEIHFTWIRRISRDSLCQSKSRAKWFQEKLLLRSRPTFWREETNIQPRPRHRWKVRNIMDDGRQLGDDSRGVDDLSTSG